MYVYVRQVVIKFLQISYVSDNDIISFSLFNLFITPESLRVLIIKLFELVEILFKEEMTDTMEELIFDGRKSD